MHELQTEIEEEERSTLATASLLSEEKETTRALRDAVARHIADVEACENRIGALQTQNKSYDATIADLQEKHSAALLALETSKENLAAATDTLVAEKQRHNIACTDASGRLERIKHCEDVAVYIFVFLRSLL